MAIVLVTVKNQTFGQVVQDQIRLHRMVQHKAGRLDHTKSTRQFHIRVVITDRQVLGQVRYKKGLN